MEKKIKRFEYLGAMLSKYAHRWGENPSLRLMNWVDEYNDLKQTENEAFLAYCKRHIYDISHNAYDCMA